MENYKGTGGQILVKCLSRHGIDKVSCVAGESYLPVLDALLDYPEIAVITCRQEGGAAFMAESWGKFSGPHAEKRPGICFVTRGPGACNAAIGVHTAMQDSTPMILFMGQVTRGESGREAFQEIDIKSVFGDLAKWTAEIREAARIPEIIDRAFKTALSGRPGPVVISLPEDMLCEQAEIALPPLSVPPVKIHPPAPGKAALAALRDMLKTAQRPVAIMGGSNWSDQGCADFMRYAAACHLPVVTSFRRQDLFDHHHNCFAGVLGTGPNPALVKKIREEADLVIVAGARLSEIATGGYSLLSPPYPRQRLVHIHTADSELGKVYSPALAIQADPNLTAQALLDFSIDGRIWAGWKDELRALYQSYSAIEENRAVNWNGADMTAIFAFLRENLPEDALITTDAGNFNGWVQRYLRYGRPGRLIAPTSGAMGYALPAAIGAALAAPERLSLGICGDGGFMMTGQELATAIHHDARPVILLCNNNMYGTIRMHQERAYPGRISATALTNPDFVKLAESYGAFSARVETAGQFPAIWEQAITAERAAIIEIRMDPQQLTTDALPG